MKTTSRSLLTFLLLFFLSLTISCDIFGPSDPVASTRKDAWQTIINAHAEKQHFYNEFIRIHSNNYKRGKLFEYNPNQNEENYLWDYFHYVLSLSDDVEAAVDTLITLSAEDGQALAKPGVSSGIFSALTSFFRSGKQVNEDNRKRLILIASNMTKADRDQLYDELVNNKWKNEIGTADEFWNKLQNGDLDDKASTFYKDFYDGSNVLLNPFTSLAIDKDLTPGQMLAKDGMNLCNKGLDVIVETGAVLSPGLSKAKDLYEDGKDLIDKTKKIVDKPLDAVVDEVKSRAASKVGSMIDIDNYFDPDGFGKYVKIAAEISLGTDDPEELAEKGIDYGIAKLTNTEGDLKPDYVVAKNQQPSAGLPEIFIGVGNYVQGTQDFIMNLPAGNWDITAKTRKGESSTTKATTVTSQQTTTVDVVNGDIQQETGVLDSIKSIIQDYTWVQIYLYVPQKRIYISTSEVNDTIKWSGMSFSMDATWQKPAEEISETAVRYYLRDMTISGHLTMVSHNEVGINLDARFEEIQRLVSSNEDKYLDIEEIQISGLPFLGAVNFGYGFEVTPTGRNSTYLNNIENIVSFSHRDVTYGIYNLTGGEISSDTTYTQFEDIYKSQLKVVFRKP